MIWNSKGRCVEQHIWSGWSEWIVLAGRAWPTEIWVEFERFAGVLTERLTEGIELHPQLSADRWYAVL